MCSAYTYWRGQGEYAHLNEHCTRRLSTLASHALSEECVAQHVHECGDDSSSEYSSNHTSTTHSLTHHLGQQCDAPSVGDTSLNAMTRVHVQPGTAGGV